jgi:lysophospholipid hydrolase
MYSRLPAEPQRKEAQLDIFPDTQKDDSKAGLANYLDEFLSAIKVFGYLERPVFHELTRTMQTRKLIAGETLLLEEEKGFCLVVDGLVQIFVKSNREASTDSMDDDEDMELEYDDEGQREKAGQGYQLLSEVKNGAPMSSLFTILSLFTEDVKLRHDGDEEDGAGREPPSPSPYDGFRRKASNGDSPIDQGDQSVPPSPARHRRPRRTSGIASPTAGGQLPSVPPLSLDPGFEYDDNRPNSARNWSGTGASGGNHRPTRPKARKQKSVHPDVLARAVVDTTIAIIPATAFRRLTRVYPKATSHIVQVILTRLQRVTLSTAHSYLGLTSEVLRTEKHMNKFTTYELPNFLRGSALERLKEKFTKEKDRIGPDEGMNGIALHNSGSARRPRSNSGLRKDLSVNARLAAARGVSNLSTSAELQHNQSELSGRHHSSASPGDLVTDIHPTRHQPRQSSGFTGEDPFNTVWHMPEPSPHDSKTPLAKRTFDPFGGDNGVQRHMPPVLHRQESIDEDGIFRESVLECIFKAIGLTNAKNVLNKVDSVEQSPRLVTYDARRQKAVFNNAFGFMDAFDASADGDSESLASASVSGISIGGSVSSSTIQNELRDDVEIVFFPEGSVLVEEGERNPGLYYVIDGFLDVSCSFDEKSSESTVLGSSYHSTGTAEGLPPLQRTTTNSSYRKASASTKKTSQSGSKRSKKKKARKSLFLIKPGGIAGYIGTVSSYRSFVDVRAQTDVYVGFLPRPALERIVDKYPVVLLTMAKRLTSLLPRLIRHIDFALEWVQVDAGQVIHHQGDESDAIYIVLNGRLRAVLDTDDGGMRVVGEYGQGESVGELEVMTESTRPATLHAIRDTELCQFPKTLFNSLALEHPGITIKISKIIASRMRSLIEDPLSEQGKERPGSLPTKRISSTLNMRTVAILPVTAGVPVTEFAQRLTSALTQIGTPNGVASLNQAVILNHLGRHAFSRMGKLKLSQYLADLEEKYGMVLYVADTNVNAPWTQTCISQADCILLVALAEGSPAIGEYERFLVTMKTTARKDLVLLHVDRYCPPGITRQWLKNRIWINGGHHHIQMAFRTTAERVHPQTRRFGSALKQRVQILQAEIQKYTSRRVRQTPLYSSETPFKGDFYRLARRLCGKSVGLVLGGGGARGISQVGIIKAIEEAGIPIDIIGGTSIGSFIGGLYARDADVVPMYGRAKKFAGRMGSLWRFVLDLTYPS